MGQASSSSSAPSSCTGLFEERLHREMAGAALVDGPLHCEVLRRGAYTVTLFGEVHSRSRCPQRTAVSVPELVRRTLQCRRADGRDPPVDLFVEEDLDRESETVAHPPDGSTALDVIRSAASAYRVAPQSGVRMHYTDPRSRLCIPSYPHIMETVRPLLRHRHQNGELNQTLMLIIDEIVRRPLTVVLNGKELPALFANDEMIAADRRTFFRLLSALHKMLHSTDQLLLRRPPTQIENDTLKSALHRYSFISNRLHDLYLLGRLVKPSIQHAVVYLGTNHARFLGQVLRTHMGFRLVRKYGKDSPAEADGCLRVPPEKI